VLPKPDIKQSDIMKTITELKSIASFSTERLFAERITAADLDKFTLLHNDPQVMATLGGLRTPEQTQENLNWNLQQWQDNDFGLWLFYLKDTHEWVGRGGLRRVEVGGKTEVEVCYALLPQFWNQGFATEITKACIEIAFEVLRLKDIVCFTLTTNKASQRVMEKAGFRYERNLIIHYQNGDFPHVLYRMHNYRKAILVSYDEDWSDRFRQESQQIQQEALGSSLQTIHHIGSTAIPNMPAKPVIDILLECNDLNKIAEIRTALQRLGYAHLNRNVIRHRSFFTSKQAADLRFHLHIYETGDPQIRRHIHFKEYLIAHPQDAKIYAELKKSLSEKFLNDMYNYVFGKNQLVQKIDAKAKLWPGRKKDFLPERVLLKEECSQEQLILAMEANLNLQMTYFAQYLDPVELIRIPGYTLVNSGLSDDTFNYVVESDFSAAEANNKIAEIIEYFSKKNLPFSWWINSSDKPQELAKILEMHHYKNVENNMGMYFDLDTCDAKISPTSRLEIVRAMDKKTVEDFALVLAHHKPSFKQYFAWVAPILTEEDPIEYYVGYVHGKPVVRSLSCYYSGVVGFYWLSTIPEDRNKGYATAMHYFQLQQAKQRGYHIAVLQASKETYSFYAKLKYKNLCLQSVIFLS
jgi:GrpB-like predicted nucleotidyltransferase (UPF0157 family)/predicted acetyltransferase